MGTNDERENDASIAGLDAEFVDVDGIRTRYYDVGRGPPLVLLHGGSWNPYFSANAWSENIDALSEQFRVVAPDRLASGLTDNPPTPEGYTYQSELDHVLGFLDAVGVEECHLAGSSRGGGLAARVAVEDPDLVRSLVLTNSATLGPGAGDRDFRWDRLTRGKPGTDGSRSSYAAEFRYVAELYCYQTDHITDEYVEAAAYMKSQPKSDERDRTMREISEDESTYRLKGYADTWAATLEDHMEYTREQIRGGAITAPVMIYWGRNDLTVRLGDGTSLFDLFSRTNQDVRFQALSRCGHLPFREHPGEFNRDVAHFIEKTDE